jgi:hypothetical protein
MMSRTTEVGSGEWEVGSGKWPENELVSRTSSPPPSVSPAVPANHLPLRQVDE